MSRKSLVAGILIGAAAVIALAVFRHRFRPA